MWLEICKGVEICLKLEDFDRADGGHSSKWVEPVLAEVGLHPRRVQEWAGQRLSQRDE